MLRPINTSRVHVGGPGECGVMTAAMTKQTESVYEHNGKQWKPLPECASTFHELLTSQRRWLEIAAETRWNPWRTDELAS